MPSDRTLVTELATALGMLGDDEPGAVVARRPREMANLTGGDWERLTSLWDGGAYAPEFAAGFANGNAFLRAADALNGRRPRIVEWTGGRRPLGDEVVPSDLRVDHVYLVSCKYLSRILHNPSPARLVEALLTQLPVDDGRDWYQRVALAEYQELYAACLRELCESSPSVLAAESFPAHVCELTGAQRRALAEATRAGLPAGAAEPYARLSEVVADQTARIWREHINAHAMLWRLLRIGSAPYFILGTNRSGSMRLRIDSPWDWRQEYSLKCFVVAAQPGGQPRVRWSAEYHERRSSKERRVEGHVEIRWSHGRFAHPPEAKVYLDSAHEEVPGYHLMEAQAPVRDDLGSVRDDLGTATGTRGRQGVLWDSG